LLGLQEAVKAKFPINVRIIIDRKTMPTLPELATALEQAGFLDLEEASLKYR